MTLRLTAMSKRTWVLPTEFRASLRWPGCSQCRKRWRSRHQLIRSQINLRYVATIELGWIVNPVAYKDQKPHLFVFFRRVLPSYLFPFEPNYCSVGIPGSKSECSSGDYQQLSSKYSAGMAIGGTPAFFYVGFDFSNNFWCIQYQNQYIAKMSESWYTCGLACGPPGLLDANYRQAADHTRTVQPTLYVDACPRPR